MKLVKKLLTGVAIAAAMASAQASLMTIDGITWDPDASNDFSATSGFYQWFQAGTAVDANTAITVVDASSQVGKYLTGVGQINTFNGANNLLGTPNPETNPAQFGANTQLTYSFGGIKVTSVDLTNSVTPVYTLDLTQSFFIVYSDPSKNYNDSSNAAANLNLAVDGGAVFLTGTFDYFGLSSYLISVNPTETILGGNSNGLISVTGGDAFGNFNTNTQITL